MSTGVFTSRAGKKRKLKGAVARKHQGLAWKVARQRVALTQVDVAKVLGYTSGQFISNVESGRCRFPGHQLPKIQKLYKLKTNEVLEIVLKEEEEALRRALSRALR